MPWVDGEYVMAGGNWPAADTIDNHSQCNDPLCDECCGNACDKRWPHSDAHDHGHAEHDHAEHDHSHIHDGCCDDHAHIHDGCCDDHAHGHDHSHVHGHSHAHEHEHVHMQHNVISASATATRSPRSGAADAPSAETVAQANTAAPDTQAATVIKKRSVARERWAEQVGLHSHDDGEFGSHGCTLDRVILTVDVEQKSCAQAARRDCPDDTKRVRRLAS
eukprot:294030-Prymnesium_polylepis.2